MKQRFAGQHFDTIDDFFMSTEAFLGGISADFLQIVCQEWLRQLPLCHQGAGEYVE
jgi:hypothetical protein